MDLETYLTSTGTSGVELARAIGVPAALISQWKGRVRPVPAERCPAIEKATGGAVRCEELRPDIEWSVLRSAPAKDQAPAPAEG